MKKILIMLVTVFSVSLATASDQENLNDFLDDEIAQMNEFSQDITDFDFGEELRNDILEDAFAIDRLESSGEVNYMANECSCGNGRRVCAVTTSPNWRTWVREIRKSPKTVKYVRGNGIYCALGRWATMFNCQLYDRDNQFRRGTYRKCVGGRAWGKHATSGWYIYAK